MQGLLLYHQRSAPQALIDLFPEIEFDVTKFHSSIVLHFCYSRY